MSKQSDCVSFIEAVKSFPVLYDTNHQERRRKLSKLQAWEDIANIMGEDSDTLKGKWKNLRDSYSKHLRSIHPTKPDTSTHIVRYKHWPWVEQMQFMRPFLEPALTGGISWKKKPATPQKQPESVTSPASAVARRKRRSSEPSEATAGEDRRWGEYDETDLIFLGYSKIVKRMSALRQASTRYQVAQVVMQAEVDQANEETGNDPLFKSSPRGSSDSE